MKTDETLKLFSPRIIAWNMSTEVFAVYLNLVNDPRRQQLLAVEQFYSYIYN